MPVFGYSSDTLALGSFHLDQPDFTIITPVYNGGEWIAETATSVIRYAQNFSYEYIIVNDGSTDDTLEILEQFSNKIMIVNQDNSGEAAAINQAISIATGKYLLIVSADDPLRSEELFEKAKLILDSADNVVCVYPDWSVINNKSEIIRNVFVGEYSEEELIGKFNCVVGPGGIFRKSATLKINGRDPSFKYVSDYDFWLRLSRLGEFKRIPGLLAYWREHEQSTSIANRGTNLGLERIAVIEKFFINFENYPNRLKRMSLGYAYFNAALLKYFDSNVPGKRWLAKSFTTYPQGLFRFSKKITLFILLYPISRYLLTIMIKIGWTRYRISK